MKYELPKGFRLAAVKSGISVQDKPDLGIIVADRPAVYAGVFTKNLFCAAPVVWCKKLLGKKIRAIIANSGCANACTGALGYQDIETLVSALQAKMKIKGNVLMSSTGIIGHRLPMKKAGRGINSLSSILMYRNLKTRNLKVAATRDQGSRRLQPAPNLSSEKPVSNRDIEDFEKAIMTTDTRPKICSSGQTCGFGHFRILGFAKGSGMIHPDLATMLAFILTDAGISRGFLQKALRRAVEKTFNRVSVDGDTSTNDSVILLSSGASRPISGEDEKKFEESLTGCCRQLAEAIAKDGEGASRLIRIKIEGLPLKDAKKAGRMISLSPLVKTAIYGADPNWGRIIASLGHSGARIKPASVRLFIQGVEVFRNERPLPFDEKKLSSKLRQPEVNIRLLCGPLRTEEVFYTCDFTEEYIKINALYRT